MKKIKSLPLAWSMFIGAAIGGISGAILLGHVLETIARNIFELSNDNLLELVFPGVILLILVLIGTAILGFAFFIENTKLKILTIVFSIAVPIIVEIVDLTIRVISVANDLVEKYPGVFN
jgi:hypothetical protein